MANTIKTYPLYFKATCLFILAFLTFYSLQSAEFILVPITLGCLFAILFTPIAGKFEKWGINRSLSSLLCIIIMALILTLLILLLAAQVSSFIDNLPTLTNRINSRIIDIQSFIERKTDLTPTSQMSWLRKKATDGGSFFTGALSATTSTFATLALVPLYTFFLLLYRTRIQVFIEKIIPTEQHDNVDKITNHIKKLVQSYLSGIMIVVFIVAVVVSAGLKIIGVPYAIFLGVMAGIFNVIPYLGILTAASLSVVISTITMDNPIAPLFVLILFIVTHLLEANFITPNVVGSKVRLNTLATLLALIIGEAIWGVVGMILFIPILGVIKVVLDNFRSLEAYGFLLGMDSNEGHAISWKSRWQKATHMFSKKNKL